VLTRPEVHEPKPASPSLAGQLLHAAQWACAAQDPDEILSRVGEGLSGLAVSVAVYRFRPQDRILELRAHHGPVPIRRPTIPVGTTGFAHRVLSARRAMAVPDCRADPGVSPKVVESGVGSFVAVPLVGPGGAVWGLVYLNFAEPQPFEPEFLELLSAYGQIVALALDRAEMRTRLQWDRQRLITSLAEAVDARDPYTAGHSRRVRVFAAAIGRVLGLGPEVLDRLEVAALLHDIGKIGVRDGVLLKAGPLTAAERAEVQEHALVSARILASAGMEPEIVDAVRHVHERYDGKGYPAGLRGEEIPLLSRILAVADAFEAMTSDRAYRIALPWEVAACELEREQGRQFDPRVVTAFCGLLRSARRRSALQQALLEVTHADPRAADPAEVLERLARAFYAFALRLLEAFERTAGRSLTEGLLQRIPVIPVFPHPGGEDPSPKAVRRRVEEYREQVARMVEYAAEVCGRRIARALVEQTIRELPEEVRPLTALFLRVEDPGPVDGLYSQ
jgi:putative nucleotidyltransferase with HDIG domain